MTDRVNALLVVLEEDIRDDDAAATIAAIRQIKGVLDVTPNVVSSADAIADMRARHDLGQRLWHVLYPAE